MPRRNIVPLKSACVVMLAASIVGCASGERYHYENIKAEYAEPTVNRNNSQAAGHATIEPIANRALTIQNVLEIARANNPDLLMALAEDAREDDLALIPEWQGRLQPLTGLYAVAAGEKLKQCADAGEHSLIGALKIIGFRVFSEDRCRAVDPAGAGFLNINRPDQLALLEGIEP